MPSGQHEALSRQAAAVIGNQRQLEMKLSRQMSEVERLQASARQALTLADQSRAKGDETKATEYEQTAHRLRHPAGLRRERHGGPEDPARPGAAGAAEQAKKAVENNAMLLQQKLVRAHPAAVPAGAGEDAGDGLRLAALRCPSSSAPG